jgi:cytochrome b subunit of formate dehydrogenase
MLGVLGAAAWLALAPPSDAACLACHGDASVVGTRRLVVDGKKHAGSAHGALECTTCHDTIHDYPHPAGRAKVECTTCHTTERGAVDPSVHGQAMESEACQGCHGAPHEIRRVSGMPAGTLCASCHEDEVKEYRSGIHAQALGRGDADGASCQSCHGPAHGTLATGDPASPVSRLKIADTCGTCHANPEFLAQHRIPFAHPVEAFKLSVHGRALARGNDKAASCSDCHGSHAVLPGRDEKSRINHWRVPETCGKCHAQIRDTYAHSVHGKAVAAGVPGAPVCTDCHGEHDILAPSEPGSLVNPARVSTVTCGRCHGDERLAARYNLPLDKLPAFEDSFHGLALRAGQQTVANCASCHGVHNILPSGDPQSSVNPANLAKTCGACHAGAGARFTIARVHVLPSTASEHPVVRAVRWFYWLIIPLTLGFMVLHNGLDWWRKVVSGTFRAASAATLPRMNLHFRIAHWLTMAGFIVLALSGFALKFPEAWWVAPLLQWEGHHAVRGTVHRVAAVVLLAGLGYHFVHLLLSRRDRKMLWYLLPAWQDVKDLGRMMAHNLGRRVEPPTFGVFSYQEKLEYWAYMWGTVVMAVSGFILWFNNLSLAWLPKWVSDAATSLHFYEAVLATGAILIWHFYGVIFDPDVYPMDKSWITGRIPADHLRRTRPGYYQRLVAAEQPETTASGPESVETSGTGSDEAPGSGAGEASDKA